MTRTLKVPGAEIHYEIRGSGPVVLCIPGGPADHRVFDKLATELEPHYTVVTYDPRGLSRSPLTAPFDDERAIEINADDASRLIAAITTEKANVLGSSGGAVISLELATRHGDQIVTLLAHETPAAACMADPESARSGVIQVVEAYKTGGLEAAFPIFMGQTRIPSGPPPAQQGEPTREQSEQAAMFQRNMEFWFGHTFGPIGLYAPDVEALRAAPCRIVSGVGEESRGQLAHEGGLGLARMLGGEPAFFPGAHGGFESHPPGFARRLREVLES